jgi:hypothetical protein
MRCSLLEFKCTDITRTSSPKKAGTVEALIEAHALSLIWTVSYIAADKELALCMAPGPPTPIALLRFIDLPFGTNWVGARDPP